MLLYIYRFMVRQLKKSFLKPVKINEHKETMSNIMHFAFEEICETTRERMEYLRLGEGEGGRVNELPEEKLKFLRKNVSQVQKVIDFCLKSKERKKWIQSLVPHNF